MSYEVRMCPEEAVEIVLKDEALDVCAHCCGVGYIENEPGTPESLVAGGLLSHQCPACRGRIAWFKAEYIEACVVLGKDVPRLNAYVTIERLRKNPVYKEQAGPYKSYTTSESRLFGRSPNIQNLPSTRFPRTLPGALEQWKKGGVVKIDT